MDNAIYTDTKHSVERIKYSKHCKFFNARWLLPLLSGLQGSTFENCMYTAEYASFVFGSVYCTFP
jgi:hypothetical protein